MQVRINGQVEETAAGDLDELVKELGLKSDNLVIEFNNQIIKQESWLTTLLQQDDVIELLSFVGGG